MIIGDEESFFYPTKIVEREFLFNEVATLVKTNHSIVRS